MVQSVPAVVITSFAAASKMWFIVKHFILIFVKKKAQHNITSCRIMPLKGSGLVCTIFMFVLKTKALKHNHLMMVNTTPCTGFSGTIFK